MHSPDLDATVQGLCDELLACAPLAVGLAKRVMDAAAKPALSATLEQEVTSQQLLAASEDFAVGVDLHQAAEDEAVFFGAQTAHAGGELRRQHGDGAVGEVDGGAAQAGFEVEVGAGADVVADVGDVDLELPVAIRERLDENGVVEVARSFAVYGDDGEAAEVPTNIPLGWRKSIDRL